MFFDNRGREDSTVTNQDITAQEPAAWIPFTANEVRNTIDATKRKKAAGPDKIYNEYLKGLKLSDYYKGWNSCLKFQAIINISSDNLEYYKAIR